MWLTKLPVWYIINKSANDELISEYAVVLESADRHV